MSLAYSLLLVAFLGRNQIINLECLQFTNTSSINIIVIDAIGFLISLLHL